MRRAGTGLARAYRSSPLALLQHISPWCHGVRVDPKANDFYHTAHFISDTVPGEKAASTRPISSLTTNNGSREGTRRLTTSQAVFAGDLSYRVPPHNQHKVCTASDAVSLVSSGDTICVSGFVGQGSPDLILEALGARYERDGTPNNLTLLFGGGPGDWDRRGLDHLAKISDDGDEEGSNDGKENHHPPPMIKRAIGSHYGQVPKLNALAASDQIEAWTLPLGSVSRMIRAQATHSPGHITTVGMGTFVDPRGGTGGAANPSAQASALNSELVSRVSIGSSSDGPHGGMEYLLYKALPVQVAVVRATTDSMGNLSLEHETLYCDQKIIAAAARNSGGVVLAQVKRLCAVGSLPARKVHVPGAMVDCVVVVDDDEHDVYHPMSYETRHDPVLTSEIRTPWDDVPRMELNQRKIIARRGSMALKPGKVVNLGIGLPESVASVAGEEGMLEYITLTTEPGVFGGLPASGRNFGPAANAEALIQMNEMFDFYDGGGLDLCFLGAGQVSSRGDVNVSRMSADKLTGPGGFIDITQSTRSVCFLFTFMAKGLKIECTGEGEIRVAAEGKVKKLVSEVAEKTFSGDEAVRRGQKVFYVTERAVFRRTARNDTLELVEIAPGVDLQRDVLDQMEFTPIVSPDLKIMDRRIFLDKKMDIQLFGSLEERLTYRENDHIVFLELFGISLNSEADVQWFATSLNNLLQPLTHGRGPVDVIVSYDGFDIKAGLEDVFSEALSKVEREHYKSVKRFADKAFRRAYLGKKVNMRTWDADAAFADFDVDSDGVISREEFRNGLRKMFGVNCAPTELCGLCEGPITSSETLENCIRDCLRSSGRLH